MLIARIILKIVLGLPGVRGSGSFGHAEADRDLSQQEMGEAGSGRDENCREIG
jgi:hypothetical protein